MKNKFAFALVGLLALSSATFAADGRDHGYRGGENHGGYHQEYRGGGRDYGYRGGYGYGSGYVNGYRGGYGYGGGGGVYLGVNPGYYSSYVAPAPYVDPYAYSAPYGDSYAAPYGDEYVGPAPYAGAIWVGGGWGYGPHGRYWMRGHWGHRR